MDEVEGWVKLLFTYGPFALLVFFVFVSEAKARSALAEANPDGRRVMLGIYVANWVAIFALVAMAVYAWSATNLNREHVIEGRLEDLRGSEIVVTDERELYMSRTYLPGGRIDYKWRLVSDAPLPEGTRIPVFFQRLERRGDRMFEEVRIYELRVRPEFYDRPVIIRYDRGAGRLLLVHGDDVDPLPTRSLDPVEPAESEPAEAPRAMFQIMRSAHAADAPDVKNLRERLEAYDPIVRYRAKQALQKAGPKALPEVTGLLADRNLGTETRVFALNKLAESDSAAADGLDDATLDAVVDALADDDAEVRRAARRVVMRHRSAALAERVGARLERLASASGPDSRVDAQRLAPAQLDLLYNLGIEEKDRYGAGDARDDALLATALARFEEAWSLRRLVPARERAPFAKALWGKALALHDRSWLDRRADGSRDPRLVDDAVAAFREFVAQIERQGSDRYPYAHHLPSARTYVANPEPESLTERYFVIAGSFWKDQRERADRQAQSLRQRGLAANVIDTDGYPNLRDGLWSVTLGPFSKTRAAEIEQQVHAHVPDAYVKAGW